MKSFSLPLLLACVPLFLPVRLVSADVFLQHIYPETGNYNLVHLTCRDNGIFPETYENAEFFLRREDSGVVTRLSGQPVDGVLTVTISPDTEGALTCSHEGETSQEVYLAAQPPQNVYFDCGNDENNPITYRLLPYSEQDRYPIACSITPGGLRERSYTIDWRSHATDSKTRFQQHTSVNETNFEVYLNSTQLQPFITEKKWLRCRVRINHDDATEESYCGNRLRAAAKAEIITPLPQQTSINASSTLNLTCTARGSELNISWTFRGKPYSPTNDCRNGVCVRLDNSSSSSPLTVTSHLSLTDIETATAGDSVVECVVRQNLPVAFQAEELRSVGTVSISAGQGNTPTPTVTPTDDTESPQTPLSPTTPPQGTSSPDSHDSPFRPEHITIALIVVPVAVAIVVVCFIRYKYKNRNTYRYSPQGMEEGCMRYSPSTDSDQTDGPLAILAPSIPTFTINPPPQVFRFTLPQHFCVFPNPPPDSLHKNRFPRHFTITSSAPLQANTQKYIINGPWNNSHDDPPYSTSNDPPHSTSDDPPQYPSNDPLHSTSNDPPQTFGGAHTPFTPHSARQVVISSSQQSAHSAPPTLYTVNEVVLTLGKSRSKMIKICSVDSKNRPTMLSAQLEDVSTAMAGSGGVSVSSCETTSSVDCDPVVYELTNEDQKLPLDTTTGTDYDEPDLPQHDKEDQTRLLETTVGTDNDDFDGPQHDKEDQTRLLETTVETDYDKPVICEVPDCDNDDQIELLRTTAETV